jgi:hypothetical protein
MIKKEFIPASQIFAAFQHHRKVSKILHDISQKLREYKFQRNKTMSSRITWCKRLKIELLKLKNNPFVCLSNSNDDIQNNEQ